MKLGYNWAGDCRATMDNEIRRFTEDEVGYWLAFHALPTVEFRARFAKLLIERFGSVKRAWTASRGDILGIDPSFTANFADDFIQKRQKLDPEKLLKALRATEVDAYPLWDPRYPYLLREINDPPLVLFARGKLFEFDFNYCVAVVGTRRPSSYGTKIAKDMGRDFAVNGAVVVSGLALGIDSLAHWGAIEGGGRTIAVVAHGADLCYPSSNKRLYNTILDGHGAVISEHPPGVTPEKWHFPARNRIISGVSKAVVVVEAGEQSGALITSKLGLEQGRDCYAVPGRVDSPMSAGTNELIMKPEAKLVRNAADVINDQGWVKTSYQNVTTMVELYGREKEVYELMSAEPVHFDMLCQNAKMNAGEMSATLTMLELAGLVDRNPGDWYSKKDKNVIFRESELPQSS